MSNGNLPACLGAQLAQSHATKTPRQKNGACRVQSLFPVGLLVAGSMLCANLRVEAQAGWTPWVDTTKAANSSLNCARQHRPYRRLAGEQAGRNTRL